MAEKSTENNMAVTSNAQYPGQSGRVGTVREDPVDNPPPSTSKAGSDNAPKKKSTFKIINITKGSAGDADGDSIGDDLDESHTDDLMSEMADNSKASDLDQDAMLTPDEVVSREKPESRFRVVKIETKEPFRRGRWLCYDFLDTPTHNERSESKAHAHDESKTATLTGSGHFPQGFDESVRSHPHTVTSGTNVHQQDGKGGGGQHPKTYGHPSQNGSVQQGNPMTNVPSQQANAVHPDRQSEGTSTMNQYPGQMSQPYTGGQMPLQQEQTAHQMPMSNIPANAHGIPNMQQGNIHPVPVMTQGQGSMHLPHNVLATQAPMSQPYPVTPQAYQPSISQVGMMMPMMTQMMTGGVDQLSYSQAPMGPLQTVYSSSQQDPRQGDPRVNASMPPVYSSNPPDLRVTSALATGQIPTDGSEAHTPGGMVNSDGIGKEAVRPDTLHLGENSMEDGSSQSAQQPALLTPLVAAVGTATPANAEQQESASRPPEVAESDSGSSSTVAIDNKIEQAMDLVKTHLMFAVREEVEVLKEQIKELMERIGNLEWENSYLRANVPPEVLTRMAQTPRSLPSSSSS